MRMPSVWAQPELQFEAPKFKTPLKDAFSIVGIIQSSALQEQKIGRGLAMGELRIPMLAPLPKRCQWTTHQPPPAPAGLHGAPRGFTRFVNAPFGEEPRTQMWPSSINLRIELAVGPLQIISGALVQSPLCWDRVRRSGLQLTPFQMSTDPL